MKNTQPILQWTPEIYFLLFLLWWTNTYSTDVEQIDFSNFYNLLPIILTIILIIQMFARIRIIGIILTAFMGLGSVVLAISTLTQNWTMLSQHGQTISITVFGILVLITNLTMVLWMGQKYKMIKIISY